MPTASLAPANSRLRVAASMMLIALPVFVGYSLVSVLRYLYFGTGSDLTIFFQALTARGPVPFETLVKGPGDSIFGDHFHPIIVLLWPALAIAPSPITLLVLQSFCLATAVAMLVVQYRQTHGGGG